MNRRQFLSRGTLGVGGLACATLAFSDDAAPGDKIEALPDGSASKGMITAEAESAIDRGLTYLAANKKPGGLFGVRGYQGNVAVCSLAGLAFMAGGNTPDRGPYGKVVSETLKFVMDQENVGGQFPGFLHNPRSSQHGPMYGHGFAALFLGEAYGMTPDPALRKTLKDKLKASMELIVRSQNKEGGWRYQPRSTDADISVTVCQIMALRSGRNAGFAVPKETVTKCVNYVLRCQDKIGGYFRYMAQGGGPQQAFARTGAGLAALYSAGMYSGPEIDAALKYLVTQRPTGHGGGFFKPDMQYFYGHYYAAQAMWTAGGKYWADWFPAIRDDLIKTQGNDGSWDDAIDPHYATAMACIILQIPNNYLPILQK